MSRLERLALAALATAALAALAAPWLAADDGGLLVATGPATQAPALRLSPPLTAGRPLGADALGRDVLARLLHGLRASLVIAAGGAAVAFVVGVAWGLGAAGGRGRFARAVGSALTFAADTASAVPALLVAAAIQAAFRPETAGFVLLLGLLRAPLLARLVRTEARRVAGAPFVLAARAAGVPAARVLRRHVLPHALTPALVAAAFAVPGNLVAEAGLGFLGLGPPEPLPTIGGLLRDGRAHAPYAVHLVLVPGFMVAWLALSCQAVAEFLRRRGGAAATEGGA